MIKKVISGHQTGVDRAAIDAARKLGIPTGGWVPRGRKSEDGQVPSFYPCEETVSEGYRDRTEKNVMDADATLIIKQGPITPGTRYTIKMAQKHAKPCRIIDVKDGFVATSMALWLRSVDVLNVAGPRASTTPGIYDSAEKVVSDILQAQLEE